MKHTYSQIDLDERRKIERWRRADVSVDVNDEAPMTRLAIRTPH